MEECYIYISGFGKEHQPAGRVSIYSFKMTSGFHHSRCVESNTSILFLVCRYFIYCAEFVKKATHHEVKSPGFEYIQVSPVNGTSRKVPAKGGTPG